MKLWWLGVPVSVALDTVLFLVGVARFVGVLAVVCITAGATKAFYKVTGHVAS